VATYAVLTEDGLNIAREIDFGGRLRGQNRGEDERHNDGKGGRRIVHGKAFH
jgi:hypothetical protein